jgi:hypothetical protein
VVRVSSLWPEHPEDPDDSDEPDYFEVGAEHPDTSHEMAAGFDTTTLKEQILAALASGPKTDDAMEILLGRSHQSLSGCRRSLVKDGKVEDSGMRGVTRYGNSAILWRLSSPE